MESVKNLVISEEIFTTNEEIENFQIGDNTIEIIGVVTKVVPPFKRRSDSAPDNTPLRVILNNCNGKKIRVLFWTPKKQEFDGRLLNQAVKISRAQVMEANPQFASRYHYEDVLTNIELSIQRHTTVEILGPWLVADSRDETIYRDIAIGNVPNFVGQFVKLTGFLKAIFANVVNGNSSYGSGALTDLSHKLLINITSFDGASPPIGSFLEIKGKVRRNHQNTIIIQVDNMTAIRRLNDNIKTEDEMKGGFKALKVHEVNEDCNEDDLMKKSAEEVSLSHRSKIFKKDEENKIDQNDKDTTLEDMEQLLLQ